MLDSAPLSQNDNFGSIVDGWVVGALPVQIPSYIQQYGGSTLHSAEIAKLVATRLLRPLPCQSLMWQCKVDLSPPTVQVGCKVSLLITVCELRFVL